MCLCVFLCFVVVLFLFVVFVCLLLVFLSFSFYRLKPKFESVDIFIFKDGRVQGPVVQKLTMSLVNVSLKF